MTYQPKILKLTRLGNPVLRENTKRLTKKEILSPEIKNLVADMRHTSASNKYGVGLSAPQINQPLAISVVIIQPTEVRPNAESFDKVYFNTEYTGVGELEEMWEGCYSVGSGEDLLFAQVPRYKKIKVRYLDETGESQEDTLTGFKAHVLQHETDHLNGIIFTDLVKDNTCFMMIDEYKKQMTCDQT